MRAFSRSRCSTAWLTSQSVQCAIIITTLFLRRGLCFAIGRAPFPFPSATAASTEATMLMASPLSPPSRARSLCLSPYFCPPCISLSVLPFNLDCRQSQVRRARISPDPARLDQHSGPCPDGGRCFFAAGWAGSAGGAQPRAGSQRHDRLHRAGSRPQVCEHGSSGALDAGTWSARVGGTAISGSAPRDIHR